MPIAEVMSWPNAASSTPAKALPSSLVSCCSKTLRPDSRRVVAELDEGAGGELDESGWAADVDEAVLVSWEGGLRQQLPVDPPCVTGPAVRLLPRQRDADVEPALP